MNSQLPTLREFFRALSIGRVERRLMVMSFVVGIVVWPVVYALKELVHLLFHEVIVWVEHGPTPFLLFVPLLIGAALTAFFAWYRPHFVTYRVEDDEEELNAVAGDGVERTIALYRSSEAVLERDAIGREGPIPRLRFPTFSLAARKFLATLSTLGGGASGGLEGSAALIGESVGAGIYSLIKRWTERRGDISSRFDDEVVDEVRVRFVQTAQIAGVSAAVTVLLGAPLASAFFATEVMYRDRPLFEKLFYGLLASLSAYSVTVLAFGKPVLFHIDVVPEPAQGLRYALYLVILAVAVTIVGQLYRVLSNASNIWFNGLFKNPVARHLAGAVIVGTIALALLFVMQALGVTGHVLELVLGSGETAIVAGLELANVDEFTAWVALIALAASMLATLATISSGGSAGLLIPSLFFGSMVAIIIAQISGFLPLELVPPAMTASLVAIAGTPITSLLFVVEVFGTTWIVPSLVVLIIAYLMSSPNSVYRTRQDAPDESELLPGIDIRQLHVPESWSGQTLGDLDIEGRFEVQIIGLYRAISEGETHVQHEVDATTILQSGDILAISGSEESLTSLTKEVEGQL